MQARLGGFPDEPVPAAADRVRHQSDARRRAPNGWDASDGVRPDGAENAAHPFQAQPDADAERSAAREPDGRERDESYPPMARSIVRSALRDAVAELCTQAAARSAARSCVVPEVAAGPEALEPGAVALWRQAALPDVARPVQAEAQTMP